ncbi:Com family DNA-binding transcriptional regulator [Delftia acidovorans]|uniref:Com family DNA-binding transcriptional regulator n=2 Tax=Comamonadaceae TaxID=80864 RepID=UPI00311A085C
MDGEGARGISEDRQSAIIGRRLPDAHGRAFGQAGPGDCVGVRLHRIQRTPCSSARSRLGEQRCAHVAGLARILSQQPLHGGGHVSRCATRSTVAWAAHWCNRSSRMKSSQQSTDTVQMEYGMQEVRCSSCNRKLAMGIFQKLSIKCPRCGTLNSLRVESPQHECHRAPVNLDERQSP